jgi:hypothetical protein
VAIDPGGPNNFFVDVYGSIERSAILALVLFGILSWQVFNFGKSL